MKILFLGTGAADWHVALPPGAERRRFSSVLVDGELLIDPGPDIFRAGADLSRVKTVLVTHTHADHFDFCALSALAEKNRLSCLIEERSAYMCRGVPNVRTVSVRHGERVTVAGFSVLPLNANHGFSPEETALHYSVERCEKRFLYACDGAGLRTETWYALKEQKHDLFILDGTCGEDRFDSRAFEHNTLDMCRFLAEMIRRNGLQAPGGRIFISHLARTLHGSHEEVKKALLKDGIVPAKDGLCLKI